MAGRLQKLKLVGYKDDAFMDVAPLAVFTAMFNPESYSESGGVKLTNNENLGSKETPKFAGVESKQLSFKLLIDGTSTSGPLASVSSEIAKELSLDDLPPGVGTVSQIGIVAVMVNLFKYTCVDFSGEIHKPRFVELLWGGLIAHTQLSSYTVNYTMFTPEGIPIRAEIDCSFVETIHETLLDSLLNRSSPDLTHEHVVVAGDSLPVLCRKIYDDESLYLEVAKYNSLVQYRRLTPGQTLYFPPLKTN